MIIKFRKFFTNFTNDILRNFDRGKDYYFSKVFTDLV